MNMIDKKIFKFQLVFLVAAFFIALGIFGFGKFVQNHVWETIQNHEYVLDCDFPKVKTIMIRADALEAVVAQEHGEILNKEWHRLILSGDKPLRSGIDVDGRFDFSVSKKDPELGHLVLNFSQTIHIGKNKIESVTKLIEPIGHIKDIRTTMEIYPQDQKTRVKTSAFLQYERKIPTYMIESIQKKLDESARKSLINNEQAITQLIKQYADKRMILPFLKEKK